MRRAVFLLLLLLPPALWAQPQTTTVKAQMDSLERAFAVHFVYDASLPVDFPSAYIVDGEASLRQNLQQLFKDTGIRWQMKKRHVVLTPAREIPSREVPKAMPDSPEGIYRPVDTLPAASITGHIDRDMNYTQTGLAKLDGAAFRRAFSALSAPDVIKTLQALPGVAAGPELLSNLYVHGGDGSDNLFLLDGVPLYQICHLGGIFSAFNTDAIETLDFYKSGFPARFGGRTSSVVDITTREGDYEDYHGTFSLGLLEGRFQLEGPIVQNKTSFNVALRRSWADAVILPICWFNNRGSKGIETWYSYAFTDLNAKVSHIFADRSHLTAGVYVGRDRFKYTMLDDWRSGKASGLDTSRVLLRWGNVLASVDWNKDFDNGMNLHLTAYGSGTRSLTFYEEADFGSYTGGYQEKMEGRGILDDLGLTARLDWNPLPGHHIRFGSSAILHNYRPRFAYEMDRTVIDCDSLSRAAYELSVYAEDEMRLTPWLTANAGLRNTVYGSGGRVWNSLEPRLALKMQCTPALSLKASYAAMSQFSHKVATTYLDLPTDCWLPSGADIPPMRSHQFAGGFYARLPHAMHLNVEGWWKTMDNLVEYNGMNTFFPRLIDWEQYFRVGKGRSYGLEVDFGYATPSLTLDAFYTLSWNERFFPDIWPDWYRDRNDNRHKLTLQANWRINEKWELYAAWNYHSGNRMSLATQFVEGLWIQDESRTTLIYATGQIVPNTAERWIYEAPNNVKLPDYHRLDFGFNRHRKTRRGNEVIWNFSLYNAYCRMNPLYARVQLKGQSLGDDSYKARETVSFYVRGVGIVPLIPTFSYTLKF
ncbi:MAG: TonB-dependent receptor plug domain-containing protein [Bacteroidales bacterium]|nr:TonB-dependent receptor plug domain-containing protein [Bacteroidales bacterium]